MVLQLVKDQFGNYTYQSPSTQLATNIASDAQAFEAYQSAQKTTLAGGTDIGGETQKLLQRELPGQQELVIDPTTGLAKAKGEIEQVDITPSITNLETSTSLATQPKETPIDIATRIASLTQRQGSTSNIDVGSLISRQQDLMKRQQDIGLISSGLNAYAAYKGYNVLGQGGAISMAQSSPITQLTQLGATPIGTSTVAGVGGAGAIGYGLGKIIGAKEKESQGMGIGAAIGMAVGGPIGAVVGGTAGGILSAAGTVICTELRRQKLMSPEDHRLNWEFTINNFSQTHIDGYWKWAVPVANKMKSNKLLTKIWKHIMNNRTKDIKWRLGKHKFNLLGRVYSILIENGSYIIGKLSTKKTNEVLV